MSCLDHISELQQQQSKTLELYKDLYDSFIAPHTPKSVKVRVISDEEDESLPHYIDQTRGYTNTSNNFSISNMVDDSKQSLDSTCDVPRLATQNTTISEMWKEFSIDKYAPRVEKPAGRPKTAPPIRKSKPRTRPRITVPDPFYMTLRDELKKPTKTKAQEEAYLKQIQKELEEEAECKKQFKASPLPPSTFQKKLRVIEERQETRRQHVKEHSKALTKAIQKPFSFEERSNLRKSRSLSALDNDSKKRQNTEKPKFYARPMPHHIFDPDVDERAREEEAYRQIRIKMRAEQLLAESQLPSSMKRHAIHYTDGRIRKQIRDENEQIAHLTEEHTFGPTINDVVPDYSLLHRQQEEAILQRQCAKPTTVIEPFNLRTEALAQFRAENPKTPERCESPPPAVKSRTPYEFTGIYAELAQSKPTIGSSLRDSATRQKILQGKKKIQEEYEKGLLTKMKDLEIRKNITEKSKALDPTIHTKAITQQRLQDKIEHQKQKECEYQEKLNDIKEKLKDRPFLFERVSLETARLSADKVFKKALTDAGIDTSLMHDLSKFEEDSLMQ